MLLYWWLVFSETSPSAALCVREHLPSATMPGLINKAKRSALPLSVSDITSCVRGYTLAMTASMTYENIEDHPIEGESDLSLCIHHNGELNSGFDVSCDITDDIVFITCLSLNIC